MNILNRSKVSLFAIAFIALIFPHLSFATVETWNSYGEKYGSVFINASSNHGLLSFPQNNLYKNEIPLLSNAVNTLADEKKLNTRVFIFNIREAFLSPSPTENFLYLSNECYISEGEDRSEKVSYDNCYIADITNANVTHENLVTIILTAQKVKGSNKVNISNLQPFKQEFQDDTKRFSGKRAVVDPKWSPNGKYLLQTVWKDGLASYEVLDVDTNKYISLPNLDALPAANPQWSANSQYVAYGSTDTIIIYDLDKNTSQTIALSQYASKDNKINDLLLSFNPKDTILFFAFDTNYYAGYKSYLWDAASTTVKFYRDDNIIPWLDVDNLTATQIGMEGQFGVENIVANPTKNKVATVLTTEDGLTTIEIFDKKNEISGSEIPVKKTNSSPVKRVTLNKLLLGISLAELLIIASLVGLLLRRNYKN